MSESKIQEIQEKLKSESFDADWTMLEEHHQRGALVLVDASLDIFEVGAHLALDNVEVIKKYMEERKIEKVSDDMTLAWKKNETKKQFLFTIVQPYVLIQKK